MPISSLELWTSGINRVKTVGKGQVDFLRHLSTVVWSYDVNERREGRYSHSRLAGRVFAFPLELSAKNLSQALAETRAALAKRNEQPKGAFQYTLILEEEDQSKFWIGAYDEYESDSISG